MTIIKETRYRTEFSPLNMFQYILGAVISISLIIGLIPGFYDNSISSLGNLEIWQIATAAAVIQIILSFVRLRLLNVLIEFILLLFILIGAIPFLGYLFRFIGLFISFLDLATFKSSRMYKQVEIIRFGKDFKKKKEKEKRKEKPKKKKDSKFDAEFIDAKFEEK